MNNNQQSGWTVLHVLLTVAAASAGLAYAFLPEVAAWFDGIVTRPLGISQAAVATIYWALWFAYGANRITHWLSNIENSVWHTVFAGAVAMVFSLVLLGPIMVRVAEYLGQNVPPLAVVGVLVGLTVVIVGLMSIARRNRTNRPNAQD